METNKKHYVYLAGNISSDLRTYEWREKFTEMCAESELPVVILNPCNTLFNQEMKKYLKRGGKNFFKQATSKFPIGVLPGKDYQMVKISTLIVANFQLIDPKKPSIGTVVEVNWARELNIPVIQIIDESTDHGKLYANHPFIDWAVSAKVTNLEEAFDIVKNFFVGV